MSSDNKNYTIQETSDKMFDKERYETKGINERMAKKMNGNR